MKEDLRTLVVEYPEFFQLEELAKLEGPKMPFFLFGFECGDGWYVILKRLFSWIKWNVEHNNYPMILVNQVKEKFGGLRFYYDMLPFEDHKWDEKYDDWDAERKEDWLTRHASEISGVISFVESFSYHICERCGSTNDVTTDGKSWIVTRCKICRDDE